MNLAPYVGRMKERLAEAETALTDPAVFANQQRAAGLTREYARLKEAVFATEACLKAEADLAENMGLLKETADPELAELAREEIARLETELPRLQLQAMSGLLPADPTAGRNTIIEIRAGAGGAESALFAADLYRMLTRYAERRNWKHEAMDTNPSDLGGFREVIFSVSGPDAFKRLKFESGVHRVQRVPATETQGRIHTSTVTVAVLPEAEEVDVEIRPDDLEITVCRASGPGGQGVNTTDSAVQILHQPTGLIVRCADERSQIKNKARAMKVLRSRLLSRKIAEEEARYAARRKAQVGTGERNEKIRTYNFPQNRVTDHRVDLSVHDLSGVLDGKLDLLIEPLLEHDLQERLKELVL